MTNPLLSKLAKILFFTMALAYPVIGQGKAISTSKAKGLAKNKAASPVIELNYLRPRTYLLEDIQVVGTQSLEPEVLIAMSGLSVGDIIQIPGPLVTSAIEKLWQQKLIKDVAVYVTRVLGNRVSLAIHIVESPRLSSYTLEGITKREKKQLNDKINLVRGKIITLKLIQSLKKNIKKHFLDLGYRDISVEIITLPDPLDAAYRQLQIKINKGQKTIIDRIVLKGNHHIDGDMLRSQLQLQEKPRFTLVKDVLYKICTLQPIRKGGILWNLPSFEQTMAYLKSHVIFSSSKFTQAKYAADKKRLIQYYQSQGYRDAAIVKEAVVGRKKERLHILFQIEEGEKYYIRDIKWVGNYLHTSKELYHALGIKPGSVYSSSLLQERLYYNPHGKDVSSIYMDDGYLFFHVEPVEVGVKGNQVDLELRVHEGTQATVNQAIIRGNHYTHEEVIRRELRVLPGEKFSRAKLFRSQRELAMLNIFDPNKIQVVPLPNAANNTVDVLFKVKESPRFDARISASLATQSHITVSADVGTNNFSLANALRWKIPVGDAQTVQLKAEFIGKHRQEFTLKFVEPWLTGKAPTAFDFSISKSFHQHANEKQSKNSKKMQKQGYIGSFGIRGGLGKRLTWPDDYFTLRTGLKYQLYNYDKYDVVGNDRLRSGSSHEVCLDVVLERNTLDQHTYPTSGSLVTLQSKMTPPYSWFSQQSTKDMSIVHKLKKKEYIQGILDFGYFYRVWGDWVINLFAHGGAVGTYSPKWGVGPFERFTMGGKGLVDFSLVGRELISLRGYPEEFIIPKDKQGYEGGVLFDKVGIELRHPIIKSSMFFVYGLLFAEAGNTWAQYKDWKFLDVKRSAGLGLRLYSPVGVIGIDLGHGFDREMKEVFQLHWSFGAGIR
jgi:outer membrane protein insertion porin family